MEDISPHVHVLAVSPNESDLVILSSILEHTAWTVHTANTVKQARQTLATHHTHVVLCEKRLPDGDWRDVLETVSAVPDGPQLIVFSKDADDRLWADVLNRGAWDVLVKPFHPKEVFQSIHLAWRHWQDGCRARQRVVTPKHSVASASVGQQTAAYARG